MRPHSQVAVVVTLADLKLQRHPATLAQCVTEALARVSQRTLKQITQPDRGDLVLGKHRTARHDGGRVAGIGGLCLHGIVWHGHGGLTTSPVSNAGGRLPPRSMHALPCVERETQSSPLRDCARPKTEVMEGMASTTRCARRRVPSGSTAVMFSTQNGSFALPSSSSSTNA